MSAKIYKIDKDSLLEISNVISEVSNVSSFAIDHFDSNAVSDEYTLNFEIEIAKGHVPHIYEEEFMVVIREKVDATSRGVNDITITNIGDDIGKPRYNKKVPHRPLDLPPGFRELKEE